MPETLGSRLATAIATKDHEAVRQLVSPDADFRAMTPRRFWEGPGPDAVLDALGVWFDDGDTIVRLLSVDGDAFADRERVGYRLLVRNADGPHLVEQQAYLGSEDEQITWLRIMCAGYRPIAETEAAALVNGRPEATGSPPRAATVAG